jgi:hypothetical protein
LTGKPSGLKLVNAGSIQETDRSVPPAASSRKLGIFGLTVRSRMVCHGRPVLHGPARSHQFPWLLRGWPAREYRLKHSQSHTVTNPATPVMAKWIPAGPSQPCVLLRRGASTITTCLQPHFSPALRAGPPRRPSRQPSYVTAGALCAPCGVLLAGRSAAGRVTLAARPLP